MHTPLTPAGGGHLKPKRKGHVTLTVRTLCYLQSDGYYFRANLYLSVSPDQSRATVILSFSSNSQKVSEDTFIFFGHWVAATFANPEMLPPSVDCLDLYNRTLELRVLCHLVNKQ
jgi:hypothetical protein